MHTEFKSTLYPWAGGNCRLICRYDLHMCICSLNSIKLIGECFGVALNLLLLCTEEVRTGRQSRLERFSAAWRYKISHPAD